MKNVLLLGGSGFVGRSLIDEFMLRGHHYSVTATARHPDSFTDDVAWECWSSPEPIEIDGVFDVIIHAATPASAQLNLNNPEEMFWQNLRAMEEVVSFCSSMRSKPLVLFTSSGSVYGKLPEGEHFFAESANTAPSPFDAGTAYAHGKRASEWLLAEADRKAVLALVVARLFAFSGRHLPTDRHFAIGNFVRDALSGETINVKGDGSARRSYMDGRDMAKWLLRAIEVGRSDFAYHVGSEQSISIGGLAELVAKRTSVIFGTRPSVEILGTRGVDVEQDIYVPSTKNTRLKLQVEQTIPLSDSIDEMLLGHSQLLR